MTDEQRPESLEQDNLTPDSATVLTDKEDILLSEEGGLAALGGGITGNEAVQQDHLVNLAREAQAEEAAAERWDEPSADEKVVIQGSSKDITKLNELNAAIESHPESASNYVFRGEMLMKLHEYAAAEADFQHALDVASTDVIKSRWGFTSQTVQDRAYVGLREARGKQGL